METPFFKTGMGMKFFNVQLPKIMSSLETIGNQLTVMNDLHMGKFGGELVQVRFHDIENDVEHDGILLPNGDVICMCCGAIQEADDEGVTWKLLGQNSEWKSWDHDGC